MPPLLSLNLHTKVICCHFNLPKQFLWEKDSTPKFKDIFRSSDLQMLIRKYVDDDNSFQDVNTTLEKVENVLISAAKRE